MAILIFLCWLVCAVLTYGLQLAYTTREFPTVSDIREDRGFAILLALFFPFFSLPVVFLLSGFGKHGLRF